MRDTAGIYAFIHVRFHRFSTRAWYEKFQIIRPSCLFSRQLAMQHRYRRLKASRRPLPSLTVTAAHFPILQRRLYLNWRPFPTFYTRAWYGKFPTIHTSNWFNQQSVIKYQYRRLKASTWPVPSLAVKIHPYGRLQRGLYLQFMPIFNILYKSMIWKIPQNPFIRFI